MSDTILSRPGCAFSNSTEWEIWSANWCDRCTKDAAFQAGTKPGDRISRTIQEPGYVHERCPR